MVEPRATLTSLDELASLLALSPSPIVVFDIDTLEILTANSRAAELYGWSVEELRTMTMLELRPPDMWPMFRNWVRVASDSIDRGVLPPVPVNTHHVARNGRIFEVAISWTPCVVIGRSALIVAVADMSERARAERRRDAALADLIALSEEIRTGVATRLHDGPVQVLTAASLRIGLLRRAPELRDDPRVIEIERLVVQSLRDIRQEMDEQRAPRETSIDVASALGALVARREWHDRLQLFIGGIEPSPDVLALVYRVVQELLAGGWIQPGEVGAPNAISCTVTNQEVRLDVPLRAEPAVVDHLRGLVSAYGGTVEDVRTDDGRPWTAALLFHTSVDVTRSEERQ